MSLIIFILIFIILNILLLKYAKYMLEGEIYTSYITEKRKMTSNFELEEIRSKVNSKFSKF